MTALPIPSAVRYCIDKCAARLYGDPDGCTCRPPTARQRALGLHHDDTPRAGRARKRRMSRPGGRRQP